MARWIALAATFAVTLLLAADAVDTLELPVRDLALRSLPSRPATATVVVAVDERSLRQTRPWPWPRADLGAIVDACASAGARGVVLDILLSDARPGDAVLAKAMDRIPTAAVAVLVENEQWLAPVPELRGSAIVAHGNFELDHDGILRRFASTKQNGSLSYTALSLEAASMVRRASAPVGRTIAPAFRTPPLRVPVVSAADLLRDGTGADALRGRIVFVGPTALGLGDRVLTPVSRRLAPDAGVTVHAAATESLLRGEEIRALPPLFSGVLAGVITFGVVGVRRKARPVRLTVISLGAAGILLGGALLLATTGTAVPFVTLMLVLAIGAGTVEMRHVTSSLRTSRSDLSRLQEVATRVAEERAGELESKRLLAHELKTPLASMRSLTQLLAGFDLSDAERHRVAVLLETEAGNLQTMVEALLDLERLPLRDFDSSTAVLALDRMVAARLDVLRAGAPRDITADLSSGVRVRGDAILLGRVVDNLVGNALRYTQSPVMLTLRASDSMVRLEVEDRGPGIAEGDRERIFQRFVRGATARGTDGLGLGLSFVAEVARWHGGSVTVESPPAGGARFVMTLPEAV
jgi:signal transduction histidine kinase